MDEKEFLKSIGITASGTYDSHANYVIELADSNDIGRMYSKLDANKDVVEDNSRSKMSYTSSQVVFINDDFDVTLISDFDSDDYKLICTRR